MSAEPDTAGFDELYSSGVVFDPAEVARVRSERGPWRELAPRAAPSEPLALGGELITPEGPREGWLVVEGDTIAQITSARPEGARPLATEAVILPGLLDLHNHPEFNVFAAWEPPQQFEHRYRWRDSPIYQQLVRDPQNELLKKVELRTETRYAEIRALVRGVTAIQGASGRDRSREEALVRNVDLQIFGERHAQTMIDLPMSDSSRADRRGLRRAQQPSLPGLVQRARSRQRRFVAPHMRTAKPEAAIERVQRRKREVDRRRRGAPLDLQVAPEVPRRVVTRERIGQRVALPACAIGRVGEPGAERADVACVLATRALRQRPAREPMLEQSRHVRELDIVAHQGGEPICRRGGSPIALPDGPGLSP